MKLRSAVVVIADRTTTPELCCRTTMWNLNVQLFNVSLMHACCILAGLICTTSNLNPGIFVRNVLKLALFY